MEAREALTTCFGLVFAAGWVVACVQQPPREPEASPPARMGLSGFQVYSPTARPCPSLPSSTANDSNPGAEALGPPAPVLAAPGAPGCHYSFSKELPLRLTADGPPYLTLWEGQLSRVSLTSAGAKAGALAESQAAGFTLRGLVQSGDLPFRANQAIQAGGFLVPIHLPLQWVSSRQDRVTLRVELDTAFVRPLPGAGLDAVEVPCGAIAPEGEEREFNPRAAIPERPGERLLELPEERELSLSRVPGGPPVTRLRTGYATPLTVLDTRGAFTRVLATARDYLVYGWVHSYFLAPLGWGDPNAPTAEWGRDTSYGRDEVSARGNLWGDEFWNAPDKDACAPHSPPQYYCDKEHDLVATVKGVRRRVGRVAAGTRIPGQWLHKGGSRWIVPGELGRVAEGARLHILGFSGCPRSSPQLDSRAWLFPTWP